MSNILKALYSYALIVMLLVNPVNSLAAEELPIGVMLCLTDVCSEPGQNALDGIRLAADEINSNGGVLGQKLVLVVEDTQEFSSGANAVSAYRKLRTNPEIRFIIGPTWTKGGLPVAPVAARDKDIIITSPSLGLAEFNETASNIFNIWPHDDVATRALSDLAIQKGWKKVVIISSQDPWETAQAEAFEKSFTAYGGTVLKKFEPLVSDTNFKVIAQKTIALQPDMIFFSNYSRLDIAARELEALKYDGPKMVILLDDARLKSAGGALEGAIVAEMGDPSKAFSKAFKEKYARAPGIAADTGYDVLKMYVQAIEQANSVTDISKISKIYRELDYTGATGEIQFDTDGGVARKPVFRVVSGQKKVPYSGNSLKD